MHYSDDQKHIGDGIRSVLEAGAVDEPYVARIMQALGCEEQVGRHRDHQPFSVSIYWSDSHD